MYNSALHLTSYITVIYTEQKYKREKERKKYLKKKKHHHLLRQRETREDDDDHREVFVDVVGLFNEMGEQQRSHGYAW